MELKVKLGKNNNVLEVYNFIHSENPIDLTDQKDLDRMQSYIDHCLVHGIAIETPDEKEDVILKGGDVIYKNRKGDTIKK